MFQARSRFRSLICLLITLIIASGLPASLQSAPVQANAANGLATSSTLSDRAVLPAKSRPSGVKVVPSCLGQRCDGAKSIYGISGSFDADSAARETTRCLNNAKLCHNPYTAKNPLICHTVCQPCDEMICPPGKLTLSAVQGLGASLVRFGVQLACPPFTKNTYYWHLPEANPDGNYPDVATIVNQALFRDQLVPVIDFLYPKQCGRAPLQAADAAAEMQDFVHTVLGQSSSDRAVYFELGNEINYNRANYLQSADVPTNCSPRRCLAVFGGSQFNAVYAQTFAREAQALQAAMSNEAHYKYWILTGSILNPETSSDPSTCGPRARLDNLGGTFDNYSVAQDALTAALKMGVAPEHLGIAVHPYHYNTSDTSTWHDYYGPVGIAFNGDQVKVVTGYGSDEAKRRLAPDLGPQPFNVENTYAGTCGDLGGMLTLWTEPIHYGRNQYQLPLVFTEDNWTTNSTAAGGAANTPSVVQAYLDGAYLVDFMSWMNVWTRNHRDKPVRVLWYRGSDSGEQKVYNLGLYSPGGGEKGIDQLLWCHNSGVRLLENIRRNSDSADFRLLAMGGSC